MKKGLSDKDIALWRRAMRNVRPRNERGPPPLPEGKKTAATVRRRGAPPPSKARAPEATLDRGWERRVRRGQLIPDRSLDLHGYSQGRAHSLLLRVISEALETGARVVLVITGKGRDGAPGILRRAVPQWLAASPLAPHILALKPAHPSHGGAGALYVILRRPRRQGP
jgi:DNA-nicking Smr family endonuclease